MSADVFATTEPRLAEALGLPRKVVKNVRTELLEQGVHWDYSKAKATFGAVCFSRAGLEATLKHLSIPPEKIASLLPPSASAVPATPPAERVEMCESGCGPAVTSDAEGVPLCAACAADLEKDTGDGDDDSPPNDPSPGAPPAHPAGSAEPPLDLEQPAVVEVTVSRCFPLNRKIVGCLLKKAEVRVRVKSNEKLRPGMVLRVSLVEGDLYELAERLPRWPGKR